MNINHIKRMITLVRVNIKRLSLNLKKLHVVFNVQISDGLFYLAGKWPCRASLLEVWPNLEDVESVRRLEYSICQQSNLYIKEWTEYPLKIKLEELVINMQLIYLVVY